MKNWRVDPKEKALVLEPSGSFMAAGCHHARIGGGKPYACGGCYARALEALGMIEGGAGGVMVAGRVMSAIRAEAGIGLTRKRKGARRAGGRAGAVR